MKYLFRSTSKPSGLLSVTFLSARQAEQKFLSRLDAALEASGLAQKVLIFASPASVVDDSYHGLTLLMGCENAGPQVQATDASIRSALTESGTAYQVLYGDVNERLLHAQRLIEAELLPTSARYPESADGENCRQRAWVWICDKCSDSQCEHRLLTDLLANRTLKAAAQPTEG